MRAPVGRLGHILVDRSALWMGAATLAGQLAFASLAPPAMACGGVPTSCDVAADDARYLLKLAVVAVKYDKGQALTWFTEQSLGFRTQDLYVFCISPEGIMDAHPDPKIKGSDAAKLIDDKGFHFGETMLKSAKEGKISEISYMWPRLEGMKAYLKHTMYTRVADQICAVGYDD